MEGSHEMVARCFRCRIRAVGLVFGLLGEERAIKLQCSVHLIGGDMVEAFALISFGQRLPIDLCGLEQREGAQHVGLGEGEGVAYGAVDMALGGEMDDAVDVVLLHETEHGVEVADVGLDKRIIGFVFHINQVFKIACVSELIDADNMIIRILVDEEPDHMGADESGTTGYNDIHGLLYEM